MSQSDYRSSFTEISATLHPLRACVDDCWLTSLCRFTTLPSYFNVQLHFFLLSIPPLIAFKHVYVILVSLQMAVQIPDSPEYSTYFSRSPTMTALEWAVIRWKSPSRTLLEWSASVADEKHASHLAFIVCISGWPSLRQGCFVGNYGCFIGN